jgi:hypothetical protein
MGQGKQVEGGVWKSLGEKNFWLSFSCVIFLGKWKKGMKNLGRWWKRGEWVGCLGYFKK